MKGLMAMLDLGREFRFKNMEIYNINNLKDFIGEIKENETSIPYIKILLMDLNRSSTPNDNKSIPWNEDLAEINYIKVIVLSDFAISQELTSEIVDFCENTIGWLEVHFDIEFFTFEKFNNFLDPKFKNKNLSHYEREEIWFNYYKKIGTHYGVQFEPGGLFSLEKLSHLSQD